MFDCKSIFIFCLIWSTFLAHYSSALKNEELIGAYPALQSEFKYQAGIVGKYNYSEGLYLICSAGIINDYLLLSSARCFTHAYKQLRKLTFFAVVGVQVLINKNIILKEIVKIYLYHYSNLGIKHDLAITRLKKSLNLQNSVDLSALKIPHPQETFNGKIGVVTGFGISSSNDYIHCKRVEYMRLHAKKGLLLRYANVTIINGKFTESDDIICDELVRDFNDICGVILPDEAYEHRGVCKGDNGAPLVIGDKVIGIVRKFNKDCDDTVNGTTYTDVSKYYDFIYGLLEGRPIFGTISYDNPLHIPGPKPRVIVASRS